MVVDAGRRGPASGGEAASRMATAVRIAARI
jgi:hypothetical protein